jgi:hypothetical protein
MIGLEIIRYKQKQIRSPNYKFPINIKGRKVENRPNGEDKERRI